MSKNILIIGGTRFFGRLLVERLLQAGHRVTLATRGQTADPFGERVARICVNRRDADAMRRAFVHADYDLVFDQICYSPLDASIACAVFGGRVERYVMASTIEVYAGQVGTALREDAIDLARERVDLNQPWHESAWIEQHYSAGKRQAEAAFLQNGRLPVVAVRIAHVLAGLEDFTGRLAAHVAHVQRVGAGTTSAAVSSFIGAQDIARCLQWVGDADFTGPINAAALQLSAPALQARIAQILGVSHAGADNPTLPFCYPQPYAMDNSRATELGYRFDTTMDWLDEAILQHAAIQSGTMAH